LALNSLTLNCNQTTVSKSCQ